MSADVNVDEVTACRTVPARPRARRAAGTGSLLPAPEVLIQDWEGPLLRKKGGREGPGWASGTWSTAGTAKHPAKVEKSLLLPRGPRV